MDANVSQRIADLEQRANSVNIALYRLCKAAGIRQNNLTRWKQGLMPSMRVFARDFPKLEQALGLLEFELAIKLIQRINPEAAPRIIAMLQNSNAAASAASDGARDSRRDGTAGTADAREIPTEAHAGMPDRAA